MIELFFAPTANGWKITTMLEECQLDYQVRFIDLFKGEQHEPWFLKISPNNKIPALIDHGSSEGDAPISVFESAAILIYLSEKTGKFMPSDKAGRFAVLQWLAWQVSTLGPTLGQYGHFKLYAPEKIDYSTERFRKEAEHAYQVLNNQLSMNRFVAGAEYSIADMACFPWITTNKAQQIDLQNYPYVRDWYEALKTREGLRRGMNVGRDKIKRNPQEDPEARKNLFGIEN